MFRTPLGENLFQAGITAMLSSLAFIRTDSYELTTIGKVITILVVISLVALIRGAIVPTRSTTISESREPGLLAALIFAGLLFGIVRRSWFGIMPSMAASIGIPESLSDRVAAALSVSLMIGLIALVACTIAEGLQIIGASLFSHRFARTTSIHP